MVDSVEIPCAPPCRFLMFPGAQGLPGIPGLRAVARLGETVARLVPLGSLELFEGSLDLTQKKKMGGKKGKLGEELTLQTSDFKKN